jgi:methyl-accepting chemotaxis protein
MKSSMTISRKITITCTILFVAILVQAIVAVYGFLNVRSGVENMTNVSVPGIALSGLMSAEIYHLRSLNMHHILAVDPADMAATEKSNATTLTKLRDFMKTFEATIQTDEDRKDFAKLTALVDQYAEIWVSVQPLSRAGKTKEAAALYFKKTEQNTKEMNALLPMLNARKLTGQNETGAGVSATATRSLWFLVVICIGSTLTGLAVTYFMIRDINQTLRQTVAELTDTASQITGAATQVESSSQNMAEGSSHQAATIEETSAASSEINSMAQRNTENSRATADMVTQSQARFEETNRSLEQMVHAMDGIASSSQKISKIIKVIDEIAFQTNILALNAAVEAARAGEAGMGFAVVADEVRNLAQRCAQAAKDTSELIEDSIQKSRGGKTKVDQVADAIRTITAESAKMKILVDEINLGSIEQARGIDQITRSINDIEQITQSSAASAQQSAGAAQQLNAQAHTMEDVVERLTVMVDGGSGTRTTMAKPRVIATGKPHGNMGSRH